MAGGGFTFSQVPIADIPRSTFNRSHGHKTTFDSGYLIPIYVDEALPGDTFRVHASMFARLATPIVPFMDNIHLDVFFFAVPNRLVWDNWVRLMGEQSQPGDSTDYLVPVVESPLAGGWAAQSMYDYFGVPVGVPQLVCSALFGRAYNLIYNEWFRDENLVGRAFVNKTDGPDEPDYFKILRRGKRHDYFTSCLPWPQKGPAVETPIGGFAPVVPSGANAYPTFQGPNGVPGPSYLQQAGGDQELTPVNFPLNFVSSTASSLVWGSSGLVADLEDATSVTINKLRQAFQIQKLLERDARGGTRYIEILRAHFGVVSPDARMQRPEYLGGGSIPVIINPVTQTSATDTNTTPQGNLAAYGVAGSKGIGFTKSFTEHCIVMGIVCARADLSYQQGLPRMFSRRTRYDFYWPAFAHLGEQAVLNKEIYAQGYGAVDVATGAPYDDEVFGYQERWAEYRYFPSKITGKFRSVLPPGDTSLDNWHLAQKFTELPVLSVTDPDGDGFILEKPPIERVVAVTNEPEFLFDSHWQVACTRPMPTYSVPGLVDHF